MRSSFCVGSILMVALGIGRIDAQTAGEKAPSLTHLALRMEVATTNDDGSPQALRFTLTNEGSFAVVLPMPAMDCITGNGRVHLQSKIIAGKPVGSGSGHGCGSSGGHGEASIVERIKKEWLQLEPGEFLAFTGDGRSMLDKSNGLITYEYWAEYEPPKLSETDRNRAQEAGYETPIESVTSAHLTFSQRWPPEE